VVAALDFLKSLQQSDGGFAYAAGQNATSDANSTAYVVQAILAAGQAPDAAPWSVGATNPISYLLDRQLPDGGLEWQPGLGADPLATQQAIPALLGRSHPIRRQEMESCSALMLPALAP
jgi:uncharacterized protein YfaS (alpha-2-macroglobulin family)